MSIIQKTLNKLKQALSSVDSYKQQITGFKNKWKIVDGENTELKDSIEAYKIRVKDLEQQLEDLEEARDIDVEEARNVAHRAEAQADKLQKQLDEAKQKEETSRKEIKQLKLDVKLSDNAVTELTKREKAHLKEIKSLKMLLNDTKKSTTPTKVKEIEANGIQAPDIKEGVTVSSTNVTVIKDQEEESTPVATKRKRSRSKRTVKVTK